MDETKTTETNAQTIVPVDGDAELRIKQLEDEKENYRKAYLKSQEKLKSGESESDDERIKRLVDERITDSEIARLNKEKDEIIARALKENKELKLAHLNKNQTPPATIGSHSESTPVRDTLVTPEQMAFFKSKNWSDQDIERYKKNLLRKV